MSSHAVLPREPVAGVHDPPPLLPRRRAEVPGDKPGLLLAEPGVYYRALDQVFLLGEGAPTSAESPLEAP